MGIFLFLSGSGLPQDSSPINQNNPYAVGGNLPEGNVPKAVMAEQESMQSEFDQDWARNSQRPTHFLDFGDGWGSRMEDDGVAHFPRLNAETTFAVMAPRFVRLVALGTSSVSILGVYWVAQSGNADSLSIPAFFSSSVLGAIAISRFRPALISDYTKSAAFVRFAKKVKESVSLTAQNEREWDNAKQQAEHIETRCAQGLRSLKILYAGLAVSVVGQADNALNTPTSPRYQQLRSKFVVEPLKKALGY
jgi:hypothetical protein